MENILSISFAGSNIKFDVHDVGLTATLQTHFKHCLGEDGERVSNYEVMPSQGDEFSISRDGSELFSNINLERVLFQLMQDGLIQLNGASKTDLVFHAAGLALDERGLMLCGKSGSGKSTLAAWLMKNGFQYLTDEVISYPLEGGQISGFARSLVLKKRSAFLWKDLSLQDKDGFLEFEDGNVWAAPTLLNAAPVCSRVVPRLLLFPTYKADAEFQVERLTTANTLFHLLQTLVNARNLPNHGMEAASQFARQGTAFSLIYSDLAQANAWIQQTLTTI